MLKYTTTRVVFREVPDETTLAINISNCPIHCPDCHSKELWKDKGKDLSQRTLERLINENPGVTCVAFMGGDSDPDCVGMLAEVIKSHYLLKVAWYSGRESIPSNFKYLNYLDYLKLGPFIKEKGPLDDPLTNQRLYQLGDILSDGSSTKGRTMIDITYKFWNKES